jgi:hypothetical protein
MMFGRPAGTLGFREGRMTWLFQVFTVASNSSCNYICIQSSYMILVEKFLMKFYDIQFNNYVTINK